GVLAATRMTHSVAEQKDRCSRLGVASIQTFLKGPGRELVRGKEAANGRDDPMQDLVAILPRWTVRLYGRCRATRKHRPCPDVLPAEEGKPGNSHGLSLTSDYLPSMTARWQPSTGFRANSWPCASSTRRAL